MKAFAIKTPIIKPKDDLASVIIKSMLKQNLRLENEDLVAVSSKAVAIANGRIVKLNEVVPSDEAKKLAKTYSLEPEFAEILLREADHVFDGVEKAVLTLKNGNLTVNAGVDHKNVPEGYAALWPLNPMLEAEKLRMRIERETGKKVGVLIVDSAVSPLRMGTHGFALATAGFKPVEDCRRRRDLYGKNIIITRHSVADDLASVAHLLMGESDERIPAVLIRDAPITLMEKNEGDALTILPEKCVYMKGLRLRLNSSF